jgi:hypothetical protein
LFCRERFEWHRQQGRILARTRKFGDTDPHTGRKWGGSPLTHWRHLKRGVERGVVDIPCGDCSACCRSGVPICEDDGTEIAKSEDGACIYLSPEGKCSRHTTRPEQCRLFTCTLDSIAGVVTDNEIMNTAMARWEWDLSTREDREFVERARLKERLNLPGSDSGDTDG